MSPERLDRIAAAVTRFVAWLDRYGETSQDHQDFYASKVGRAAKSLYYRHKLLGTAAVLPMVACEAFAPSTRRFFFRRMRLPIADAHYAMGFALRHRVTGDPADYRRAVHFLEVLESERCPAWERWGWGYPFDWQTRGGTIPAGTPLITTTPYCYEAFEYVLRLDGDERWRRALRLTADHALIDYGDVEMGPGAASCTYIPGAGEKVVNASAYRSFLLFSAEKEFGGGGYAGPAERNLRFVLQSQRPDGAWPYAMDGTRDFVDHFHTCFVLKGLAKIERLRGGEDVRAAIDRGVGYYLRHLFSADGLPRPFAVAPRLTVYKRELYDCAECLNLAALLAGRFPELDAARDRLTDHLLDRWARRDGSFRSRKLLLGYDNVPMHRWGQSELFRSWCLLLAQGRGYEPIPLA